MTNVVELSSRLQHQKAKNSAVERAAVVADLVALTEGVRETVEKAVDLTGSSMFQLEHAVQHLGPVIA